MDEFKVKNCRLIVVDNLILRGTFGSEMARKPTDDKYYTRSTLRDQRPDPDFVMFNCDASRFCDELSEAVATRLTKLARSKISDESPFGRIDLPPREHLTEILREECKKYVKQVDKAGERNSASQIKRRIEGFRISGLVSFEVLGGAVVIRKEVWEALKEIVDQLRTGSHLDGNKVPSNTSELILGIQRLLNARFGPMVGIDDFATLTTKEADAITMMKTALEKTTEVVPSASSPSTDQVGSNGRDPEPLEPDDRWRQEVGIEFSWGDDAYSDIQMTLDDDWLPAKVSLAHAASFLRMKEDLLRNLLQTKRIRRYRYGFSSFDLVKLGIELGGCHIQTLTLWSKVFSEDYRWDDEQTPIISYSGVAINGVVFFDPEYEGDYFDFKVEREFFVWGMAFRQYILGLKSTGRKIDLFDPRSIQGSPNFED